MCLFLSLLLWTPESLFFFFFFVFFFFPFFLSFTLLWKKRPLSLSSQTKRKRKTTKNIPLLPPLLFSPLPFPPPLSLFFIHPTLPIFSPFSFTSKKRMEKISSSPSLKGKKLSTRNYHLRFSSLLFPPLLSPSPFPLFHSPSPLRFPPPPLPSLTPIKNHSSRNPRRGLLGCKRHF